MGRLYNIVAALMFCICARGQNITVQLDEASKSIPVKDITNRVGELKIKGLRFKVIVWRDYVGVGHLIIRDKSGRHSHNRTISKKDGVLVRFRTRLKKIRTEHKKVKLEKLWIQQTSMNK